MAQIFTEIEMFKPPWCIVGKKKTDQESKKNLCSSVESVRENMAYGLL